MLPVVALDPAPCCTVGAEDAGLHRGLHRQRSGGVNVLRRGSRGEDAKEKKKKRPQRQRPGIEKPAPFSSVMTSFS